MVQNQDDVRCQNCPNCDECPRMCAGSGCDWYNRAKGGCACARTAGKCGNKQCFKGESLPSYDDVFSVILGVLPLPSQGDCPRKEGCCGAMKELERMSGAMKELERMGYHYAGIIDSLEERIGDLEAAERQREENRARRQAERKSRAERGRGKGGRKRNSGRGGSSGRGSGRRSQPDSVWGGDGGVE